MYFDDLTGDCIFRVMWIVNEIQLVLCFFNVKYYLKKTMSMSRKKKTSYNVFKKITGKEINELNDRF